jgi:O-antigen/teichoic acid export membrane protein
MDWASLKESLSPKQRFNRDVLWNVGSLGVLGVAGVVLSFVIGGCLGEAALGVFNQVYAAYVFLGQLAVGGVHTSVLKHVSHKQDDAAACSHAASTALALAFVLSAVACVVAYSAREWIGRLMESPDVATGLAWVIPGLLFFSLNKVLLNVLNGVRHMRAFAVFNSLRFALILGTVLVLIVMKAPPERLPLGFSVAEVLLFIGLMVYVNVRLFVLRLGPAPASWLREHVSFSVRGGLSGILSGLNVRVDVLMMGYFCSDHAVGVYALAASVASGFLQLPAILQRNVNPILGKCFAEGNSARIEEATRKIRRLVHPGMALLGLAAVAVYPLAIKVILPGRDFGDSWPVFCVLMLGTAVVSGYLPMGGILLQGGRPGAQTLLMACTITANAVMNALMIPHFDAIGAATATACAYVLQVVLLLTLARRFFGLSLWR